ncbi:uncharacterized protein TrAtP1_009794 [Trichoderma atroviride]|uniref:uncharacterized protein n=1 Tax=Hypocrea atroviridis TaxID=63577 RepID=UPI003325B332|nr:hypothetical protein TrAtP1_009794 [Trichoderma atroviride]
MAAQATLDQESLRALPVLPSIFSFSLSCPQALHSFSGCASTKYRLAFFKVCDNGQVRA